MSIHKIEDYFCSDIKPRILNDGTLFFVKESVIRVLVGIQKISVVFFSVDHFSQNGYFNEKSLVQNLC